MYVLHGGWVPAPPGRFVRGGRFLLWAERGLERGEAPGYRVDYLDHATLRALLDALGLPGRDAAGDAARCRLRLPCSGQRPLPSPGLARRLGVLPESGPVTLRALLVDAYPLADPLAGIDELRFAVAAFDDAAVAMHGDAETEAHVAGADADGGRYDGARIALGDGLRFWFRANALLKQLLRKDHYVPALRCAAGADGALFFPAWDIVAPDFDTRVAALAARMPAACRAAAEADGGRRLYDAAALLRHYLAVQLTAAVTAVELPATTAAAFNGSFVKACLRPDLTERVLSGDAAEPHYRRWRRWRRSLRPAAADGVRLGLVLQEAPSADASWRLQLTAIAADAESRPLPLIAFWQLDAAARRAYGTDAERRLLTELGLAARVYPPLWQTLEERRPDALVLDADRALKFLRHSAGVLVDAGFHVSVPDWWTPGRQRRARLKLCASPEQPRGATAALDAVRFQYRLALGDVLVDVDEWRRLVASKASLVRFRGRWIELERTSMNRLMEALERYGDGEREMPLAALWRLSVLDDAELDCSASPPLADALAALRSPERRRELPPQPAGFQGRLRGYQRRGLAWLSLLEGLRLNGCLADDMGLGKTVQVIARLLQERADGDLSDRRAAGAATGVTLLVAPTSVLGNWQNELHRFAPSLTVLLHHGGDRHGDPDAFAAACAGCDVVLTSYALARRDAALFGAVDWHRLVLDEAQNIKNPQSGQTRAVNALNARHRLALTGTPVENRLLDLWSVMQFLNPGYLGQRVHFRNRFELPIQKHGKSEPLAQLRELTRPFILRRLKTDKAVIRDLPDKIEQVQYCRLTAEQAALYQAVVDETEAALGRLDGDDAFGRRGVMLSALLRLKQICNHPRQYLRDDSAFVPARSHKLTRLDEMVGEALAGGASALVFTQFTELGNALERYLRGRHGCPVHFLHGGVARARRERMVDAFQDPGAPPGLFLLSLKAGGVGVNLTRASQVFHYDRWWNPAVEDQATDRAYRIGQTRSVFVHKFVTVGTLEERIDGLLRDKKRLASGVVGSGGDDDWLAGLDNGQFKALVALGRGAVA